MNVGVGVLVAVEVAVGVLVAEAVGVSVTTGGVGVAVAGVTVTGVNVTVVVMGTGVKVAVTVVVVDVVVAIGEGVAVSAVHDCKVICTSVHVLSFRQTFRVMVVFSSARQSTSFLSLNLSTVLQPRRPPLSSPPLPSSSSPLSPLPLSPLLLSSLLLPEADANSSGETTSNFASLGISSWACAMLSTQYWQSNEITSRPVTGMDGVSVVFVAVA